MGVVSTAPTAPPTPRLPAHSSPASATDLAHFETPLRPHSEAGVGGPRRPPPDSPPLAPTRAHIIPARGDGSRDGDGPELRGTAFWRGTKSAEPEIGRPSNAHTSAISPTHDTAPVLIASNHRPCLFNNVPLRTHAAHRHVFVPPGRGWGILALARPPRPPASRQKGIATGSWVTEWVQAPSKVAFHAANFIAKARGRLHDWAFRSPQISAPHKQDS